MIDCLGSELQGLEKKENEMDSKSADPGVVSRCLQGCSFESLYELGSGCDMMTMILQSYLPEALWPCSLSSPGAPRRPGSLLRLRLCHVPESWEAQA